MDVKKVYRKMVVLVKYFKMCASSFFASFSFPLCKFVRLSKLQPQVTWTGFYFASCSIFVQFGMPIT